MPANKASQSYLELEGGRLFACAEYGACADAATADSKSQSLSQQEKC